MQARNSECVVQWVCVLFQLSLFTEEIRQYGGSGELIHCVIVLK